MNELTTRAVAVGFRDINTVTAEFKLLYAQAQQMAVSYIMQLGMKLVEAKSLLESTEEFERWLADEVHFSKSTAYNYMKIYKELGADQASLFGEINSNRLEKLPYTQLLLLLKVPESERDEFLDSNDVENMSKRELAQAIKERDEARKEAEEQKKLRTDAESTIAGLKKEVESSNLTRESNDKRVSDLQTRLSNMTADKNAAEEKLKKLKQERKAAQEELEKAKKSAEVSPDQIKKIEKEAAEKAKKAAEEQEKALRADIAAQEAEIERLQKQLKASDAKTAIFSDKFNAIQKMLTEMDALLKDIAVSDPEKADKLKGAIRAVLDARLRKYS